MMIRTSIGHHTATVSMRVDVKDAKKIYQSFCNYRDETNEIKMYIPNDERVRIQQEERLTWNKNIPTRPRKWSIDYSSPNRQGINWTLRFCNYSKDFKIFIIEARLNPKILVGMSDYISAASEKYLEKVQKRFDEEAGKISSLLGNFSWYSLKRIDFCINFDLKELGIKCTPEQMMELIKRGKFPPYYSEWK